MDWKQAYSSSTGLRAVLLPLHSLALVSRLFLFLPVSPLLLVGPCLPLPLRSTCSGSLSCAHCPLPNHLPVRVRGKGGKKKEEKKKRGKGEGAWGYTEQREPREDNPFLSFWWPRVHPSRSHPSTCYGLCADSLFIAGALVVSQPSLLPPCPLLVISLLQPASPSPPPSLSQLSRSRPSECSHMCTTCSLLIDTLHSRKGSVHRCCSLSPPR